MSYWKYKLEFEGKVLRCLINKEETVENIISIYKHLIICLEKLKKKLKKEDMEDWEYDIETMIDDLYCAIPSAANDTLSYEDEQENINYWLRVFYDMCDAARVWIGI